MAYEIPGFKFTLVSSADLTAKQYHAVKLHTTVDQCAAIADDADVPCGILQDGAASGAEAEIMGNGISKMVAGTGGITLGAKVTVSAVGRGIALSAADQHVIGIALSAASEGETFSILFSCLSPNLNT